MAKTGNTPFRQNDPTRVEPKGRGRLFQSRLLPHVPRLSLITSHPCGVAGARLNVADAVVVISGGELGLCADVKRPFVAPISVPNAALPTPSWEGDCLPNAVIRPLVGECPVLRLSVIHCLWKRPNSARFNRKHRVQSRFN